MQRKRLNKSRYLAAFFFTVAIFLSGLIVGNHVSDMKLQALYNLQNELRVESLGNELMFQLVEKNLCENINLTSYTEEISKIGQKLTYMESLYGYEDIKVWSLKSYYSLLLVRHLLITEKAKEECNKTTPVVLYFYSNKNCEDCEDQGLVLTNIHKNYPLFHIYSFEYALNNAAVDFLKEKYEIDPNRLPTIVIDNKIFYGFQSKKFLLEYMDLEKRLEEDKLIHPEWYK